MPGNAESDAELAAACRDWVSAHVLHGAGVTIDGVDFWGLGGGVPVTPFGDWSYDFTEEEAAELLGDLTPGTVLVSHSPPLGAVDRDTTGRSLGSRAVSEAIRAQSPALVVCGHIHACWEQVEDLDGVPVVNAGPGGVLWDLETDDG